MKDKSPVPSPLRYCASCAVTLLFWAGWLILVAALAVQAYVGVTRDVPVPGFVLRRIEAGLAAENFSVRFGSAHFDPTGGLLLENVQLRVGSFDEPLLSSRLAYTHKSIWSVLAGRPVPDEVRFEGATLQLPAMYSPSGAAEPLLREMAGTVRFEPGQFFIDQLACHVGSMPVTFRGVVTQPRGVRGEPLTAGAITARFLQYGRQVALVLPDLDAADTPALAIEASARPQGGTSLELTFTADGLRQPAGLPLDLGRLLAEGRWTWDGVRTHTARLRVWLDNVTGPHGLAAENVRGRILLEPPAAEFASLAVVEAHLAAGRIRALDEDWMWPVAAGSYSLRYGKALLTAGVQSHHELLAAAGAADLRERSAQITVDGRVPPALVTGLLSRRWPKLEPYFRFGDPVDARASLTLGPGWRFAGLATHVRGGRLNSHGVQITSTRGRIDLDADLNFLAYDAHVVAGENEARGSYWMNFHTFDYRMLLTGKLRPAEISGWFRGEWWPDFWKNFSFAAVAPLADVDVQGCWKDPTRTFYFGSTDATKPVVLGAGFDRIRTRVLVRPQFAHVLEFAAERGGGAEKAAGWFQRRGNAPGRPDGESSYDYDVTANLDPSTYQKMGGETATKLMTAWKFDRRPQLHVVGHTEVREGKAVNALQFTGDSNGGTQFEGVPLDRLSVTGDLKGDDLQLNRLDFQFAGGQGSGQATLSGPPAARQLKLNGKLKDADLARTIIAIQAFAAVRTGAKASSLATDKFIKRATGGKVELAVSAQGNPANLASLQGKGNVQVTGAELGEIQLFGLLSQALSAVALNFSSLKFDAAHSSFQIDAGRVHFPDVKVTGPSAVIEAQGDYVIASKSLDFKAKLKPYEESHNPLTAVVGIVINPLTSIFELKLTGPLAKPSWSIVLGQGPKTEKPAPPVPVPEKSAPPAPANAEK